VLFFITTYQTIFIFAQKTFLKTKFNIIFASKIQKNG